MTPMGIVPTLADFLLARIAEDEEAARDVIAEYSDDVGTGWGTSESWEHNLLSSPAAQFTRSWSPERVLAECEAKRAIVEGLADDLDGHGAEQSAADFVLCLLALPYADHPDYRREWAPGAPLSPLSPGVS